jgi:hypothetical protein
MKLADPRLEEIRCLLIDAMFMLEMMLAGDSQWSDSDLIAAGHSMSQRAKFLLVRSDYVPPVTQKGMEILATEQAAMLIEDARSGAFDS